MSIGEDIHQRQIETIDGPDGLVLKNGVLERHRNGSVDFSSADWQDMKVLGRQEIKSIILERANNLIEEKRSKEIKKLEALKKELDKRRYEKETTDFIALKLLKTGDLWEESKGSQGKYIWRYLDTKESGINTIADEERVLAEASLNENLLILENETIKKENGETYDRVGDYYIKIKDLKEVAEELEKIIGEYGSSFSILGGDYPLFIATALHQTIEKWEQAIRAEGTEIEKQKIVIEKLNERDKKKTRKEIAAAEEIIKGKNKYIVNVLESKLNELEAIKDNLQIKLNKFFAMIPKDWLKDSKLSEAIFTEHKQSDALTKILSSMEYNPENFTIISEEDVKICKEFVSQINALEEAIETKKQAEASLAKTQQKLAELEREYLGPLALGQV